jgi:superfamily II DNA or RNA helicase
VYGLRDYQDRIVKQVYGRWHSGDQSVLLQLPTAGGKTVTFGKIAHDCIKKGHQVLILAHRKELIVQAGDKVGSITGVVPSIIKAGYTPDVRSPLQVASIQSLVRRLNLPLNPKLIIYDECFPAGTLVDGKPIESLRVGEFVTAFDDKTGGFEEKRIVRLFKKTPSGLVTVKLSDGESITCTPEHPFYTNTGWVVAKELTNSSEVIKYVQPNMRNLQPGFSLEVRSEENMFTGMSVFPEVKGYYRGLQEPRKETEKSLSPYLHSLRKRFYIRSYSERKDYLQENLFRYLQEYSKLCHYGFDKQGICFGSDESQQSYAARRSQGEGKSYSERDWSQTEDSRGQRKRYDGTTSFVKGEARFGLGSGVSGKNATCQRLLRENSPESLQIGFSKFTDDDSRGNRWVEPSISRETRTRSEENGSIEFIRVESVEIHQRGSDGKFGGMCPDGFVYNIEVEDFHTYTVGSGIVVHNCHHIVAGSSQKILNNFPNSYLLGVTATPVRLNGQGFDHVFDSIVTGPSVKDLVAQGYLSKFKLFADPSPMNTKGVKTQGGDYNQKDLAQGNDAINLSGNLVESYKRHCNGKRCIVFAINVEHSIQIAKRYNEAGIPAAHLDGTTPEDIRQKTIDAFSRGELRVLSNVGLFDEGFDLPALDAVQIAKPTKSLTRWLQMVGRVLRTSPDKQYAIIIDHTLNWAIHGLPTRDREWSLQGVEQVQEPIKICKETGEVVPNPEREKTGIQELDVHLVEVEEEEESYPEWRQFFNELRDYQLSQDFNTGWLMYKLESLFPPMVIWQLYAEYAGYKLGWAYYKSKDQERVKKYPPNIDSFLAKLGDRRVPITLPLDAKVS